MFRLVLIRSMYMRKIAGKYELETQYYIVQPFAENLRKNSKLNGPILAHRQ